jgi:hypothetical protein
VVLSSPTRSLAKCCYFRRGNTKSGLKITSHILSQEKEVGSLGQPPGWAPHNCSNLMTLQRPAPGTAKAWPWNGKYLLPVLLCRFGWYLIRHYKCVCFWLGLMRRKFDSWVRITLNVRCVLIASMSKMFLPPPPTPSEAHDISSVLEMTEDMSLCWDFHTIRHVNMKQQLGWRELIKIATSHCKQAEWKRRESYI